MSFKHISSNKFTPLLLAVVLLFFTVIIYSYRSEFSYEPLPNGTVSTTTPNINPPTPTPTVVIPPAIPPSEIPPTEIGHEMGIAAGSKLIGYSDDVLDKDLKGMVDLGVKWVRFDIEWGFVQYSDPDRYDWSKYDRIIDALNAYNLKALPILTYTPEWARAPGCGGGAHCPPKDPKTFARFAEAAVARYKSKGVHYWEIWNEPNSYDFWATKADCKAYTELLKVTYHAIKKTDSQAFVITGGLAQINTTDVNISPFEFLQCIYKQGGKNYFDAVGNHPYTFPALPSDGINNAWGRMSLTSPSLRSIMIENGDFHKKIWMTEYGAPTNGPDPRWFMSEERQSQMVTDTLNLYKTYDWAGPIFWYTFVDSGTEPTSNENFFGFARFDWSKKPAYTTLKNLIFEKI